jgi:hypothetical protein
VHDFKKVKITEGKAKFPQCRTCKYDNVCEGPWREYPEKFGSDEFKPIIDPSKKKESMGKTAEIGDLFSNTYLSYDDASINKKNAFFSKLKSKKSRVLILFKNNHQGHLRELLAFFDNSKINEMCYHNLTEVTRNPEYSLKNIRAIPLEKVLNEKFDYIIAYCCMDFIDTHKLSGKIIMLLSHVDEEYIRSSKKEDFLLEYPKKSIACYNLMKDGISFKEYNHFYKTIEFKDSIRWPPDIPVSYKKPDLSKKIFDFVLLNGNARNFKFICDNLDLFDGKKVVIIRGLEKSSETASEQLNTLKKQPNFIFTPLISFEDYCKILLHSKIAIDFYKSPEITARGFTFISDAMWYGIPIITNKVNATSFLGKNLFFVNTKKDFVSAISALNEPKKYKEISSKLCEYAYKNHNIWDILISIYNLIS